MVHYLLNSKSVMKKETKQTIMGILLKRVIPPQEEPQLGLGARGVPGEVIVSTDESSRYVIASSSGMRCGVEE